jgi:hypothetical protein
VFDVFRLAKLAGPLAVVELTGGVGVEETKAIERDLLEARFERLVEARFVTRADWNAFSSAPIPKSSREAGTGQ